MHWHDAGTLRYTLLRRVYAAPQGVDYAPSVASYAYYATCVASGSLSWRTHLRMITFQHGLAVNSPVQCPFCARPVTAAHIQSDCPFARLWSLVLYTHLTREIQRIVPEWETAVPTYWGVLVQWGGKYLGFTTELIENMPISGLEWVLLPLNGCFLSNTVGVLLRHGATKHQVQSLLVSFWKSVLRLTNAVHPPQFRDTGSWVRGPKNVDVYDMIYPAKRFPAAGDWCLLPPDSSIFPSAWYLHIWHHMEEVSVLVLARRIAYPGASEVLYWGVEHSRLLPWSQWPRFASDPKIRFYIIDLPSAPAKKLPAPLACWFVLRYNTTPPRFLAGYAVETHTVPPQQACRWWERWWFHLQCAGLSVHAHFTDLRLRMTAQ